MWGGVGASETGCHQDRSEREQSGVEAGYIGAWSPGTDWPRVSNAAQASRDQSMIGGPACPSGVRSMSLFQQRWLLL